jgi:mannose-6-phosphate isomerase
MAIEHACMRVVRKPWRSTDLRPWSEIRQDGVAIDNGGGRECGAG